MVAKIVIINGSAGVGKDSFVSYCKDFMGEDVAFEMSTIDLVKSAMMVLGWNGQKTPEARRMMSDIKAAWIRYNDGAFNYVKNKLRMMEAVAFGMARPPGGLQVVFVHVREPAEINKFVREYGRRCVTVLVRRPGIPVPDNDSDRSVADCDYNVIIDNVGGLSLLRHLAEWFCREYVGAPRELGEVEFRSVMSVGVDRLRNA